jgi:retinol dehydrogenase-12
MEPDLNLSGKICMITGATSGIGEATAERLASLGASVVFVGRDPKKCASVAERIKETTHNPAVDFLVADLSSQKDIRRIVQEFKSRFSRLNVLVNNVGAIYFARRKSVDGIEMTFALNHLAPFLLTNLLLDTLISSAPARIINITSAKHGEAVMNFGDLENKKGYNSSKAYSQSKLANVLFTIELARRLQGRGVTVNAIHPGFVESNLGKNNAGILRPLVSLLRMGGITPQTAADYVVYLAASEEVAKTTGSYFYRNKISTSLASYDEEAASLLWEVSAARVGLQNSLSELVQEEE